MSLVLNGTTGITNLPSINSGQIGGRRNIVINGEMKVAQRSASVAGLGAATGYFTLDRWQMLTGASAGRFTMAQVADGPAGIANCLKLTTTTADTDIAADEVLILQTKFEGQDVQQLKKGTASAEQVTVSFYVKGNAAALYVCELFDVDNGRCITQSFAVTTSWNRIELTFAADTSDPLDDNNAVSLQLSFWLHSGSDFTSGTFAVNTWNDYVQVNRAAVDDLTSIFDATSRTFSITGVQMEIGTTATDFEHRGFGEELALCQRYYTTSYSYGTAAGTATYDGSVKGEAYRADRIDICPQFKVAMRAVPTVTIYSPTSGSAGNVYLDHSVNADRAAVGSQIGMTGFGSCYRSAGDLAHNGNQHATCQYIASAEL
jgi:hypothetical protein